MKGRTEMYQYQSSTPRATGGCLCGAVKYEVNGKLYNVIICHCSKCRHIHGHVSAHASSKREDLRLLEQRGLKWYQSVKDETPDVYRGFCKECGSSLFWDPRGDDHIYISAGTLDQPTGLKTIGHIWLSQAGDYYEITDDLEKYEQDSNGKFVANAD
ncbi:MAG: GFA family protein [Thermodesulfobacteriota bacterium]